MRSFRRLVLPRLGTPLLLCVISTSIVSGQPANTSGGGTPVANENDAAATGFFQIVLSGGWVGALIMLTLLALSLTAAYLIFEQIISLRRSELVPQHLGPEISQLAASGRVADAAQRCHAEPSLFSLVLLAGLSEADGGWHGVEKAVEDALSEQAARLLRKIEYLSLIGNLAPMVGLLGTVTGMVFAFQKVATTGGAAGAADLAEGIYQALVTTIGGLLVAIPALAAFAIFRNRVDGLMAQAAHEAQQALRPLKRQRFRAPPPPRAGTS